MTKYKKDRSSLIFDIVNYVLLTVFFIVTLYPFYYIFIYSISDPIEAQKGIVLFPTNITFNNYIEKLLRLLRQNLAGGYLPKGLLLCRSG